MAAGDPTQFYSPGRLRLLLWRYNEIVQLCRGVAGSDGGQKLPRETPEACFERGAVIKADIDRALISLDAPVRRVVVDYWIRGYAAVEIARMIPGCNRWFVDRARHRGILQMALMLKWQPEKRSVADGLRSIDDDDVGFGSADLHERMGMIVARAFNRCPKKGPPGYSCPVLDCGGHFDHLTGDHEEYPEQVAA